MSTKSLKIGDLTVEKPIIQGGMGVGISLGGLAGAVAREGGIGIISAAQIGYREPDFDTDTLAANLRAIGKEYERAREIAPRGVIGFNQKGGLIPRSLLRNKLFQDVKEVIY